MAGEGRNASLASQMSGKRIQDSFAEQLASIPEFSGLGSIFKSSSLVELTESDTEYVVSCIKHLFSRHLVLQVSQISKHLLASMKHFLHVNTIGSEY